MFLQTKTQLLILLTLALYTALAKHHNYEHDHDHRHSHEQIHHHSHDDSQEQESEYEYEHENDRSHNNSYRNKGKHDDKYEEEHKPIDDKITLNNGAQYPLLGFGTITLKDTEIEKALDTALELGFRHIDTAFMYENEVTIGNVLRKWLSSDKLKREDVFVTTKLPRYGNKPELVSKYLEESLKNLQLDYVDLYTMQTPMYLPKDEELVNSNNTVEIVDTDIVSIWKALEEQVKMGKTKAIGVTSFNQSQLIRIKNRCTILPAVLQTELHVYLQEKPLVEFCKKSGIAVALLYPFEVTGGSFNAFFQSLINKKPAVILNNEVLTKIGQHLNKSTEQILLRFFVQQGIAVTANAQRKEDFELYREIFNFSLTKRDMHLIKNQDKGESGRIGRLSDIFKGIEKHPEYPFPY